MLLNLLINRTIRQTTIKTNKKWGSVFSRYYFKKSSTPGPANKPKPLKIRNPYYSSQGAYWRVYSLTAVFAAYVLLASYFPFAFRGYTGSQRNRYNFINNVVKVTAPAVVYIEILDPNKIDKITRDQQIISNGSGFIIRKDGWIITNAHVIISKPRAVIKVQLNDGTVYEATVEDADMNLDLALLKINAPKDKPFPILQFAKAGDVKVGEWVVALGSPLSLTHSVTAGVVSSVNRLSTELGLMNLNVRYIQTDASITFGNSGGPLVNLDGHVVGINNLRITSGISFAIPIEYVNRFLLRSNAYIGNTKVEKEETILGLTTINMNEYVLQELLQLNEEYPENVKQGILVWKILDGGTAQLNGLETGDIITEINGSAIGKAADLYKFFTTKSKTPLDFKIIRRGKLIDIKFKPPIK